MVNKFIVSYDGRNSSYATQQEAEDAAKRKAYKDQDYQWFVYQAIVEAKVPAPVVELVAVT